MYKLKDKQEQLVDAFKGASRHHHMQKNEVNTCIDAVKDRMRNACDFYI